MSNILPKDKQVAVIASLCEGASIRSIERITGIHRDTIMRLGLKVGKTCARIMDEEMRGLDCEKIQVDEIWGFVGKKARNVLPDEEGKGDTWTWVAFDPITKLVPCFNVSKRDQESANEFMLNLAPRLNKRVQISSDGLLAYRAAVEEAFGDKVDYGQIVKSYAAPKEAKRSRPVVTGIEKTVIDGKPVLDQISTSLIERQNLTIRMHNRRMTRKTNAFSKKLENFKASMALHFTYYNFVRAHKSLKCTPAMAAGVADSFWTVQDLVEMAQ